MEKLAPSSRSATILAIPSEQAGQRVDNFLMGSLKGVPRSHVYKILRTGQVRVNSKRVQASYRLVRGDLLRFPPVRVAERTVKLAKDVSWMTERILYEDEMFLVFNKPSGMAVHGGSGISLGVIEGLRQLEASPYLELVHRLDRETSGCLLIAKSRKTLGQLHTLLRENQMQKTYVTLVGGRWNVREKISLPLVKNHLQSGERIVKVSPQGKEAFTRFEAQEHFAQYTLLKASPITGRTHQIRVHAAYMGHPICGDQKYGNKKVNTEAKALGLSRLFLHAARVQFTLLDPKRVIDVCCPLDRTLVNFLERVN